MKFRRKKGEDKLYEQWVKHGDLPPEAIPQKESPEDVPVEREKKERTPRITYILIGAGILIWGICLVLLLVQSC